MMVDPFILGDKIFDKSYETQFKSVDKGDFISVINNIRKEYNSKNGEEKFLLELAMKDKINGTKISLLVAVILIIGLFMFSNIDFFIVTCSLVGLATVWEAYMLKKEYRYAKLYLEVINKVRDESKR